jgi:hypothetical protein
MRDAANVAEFESGLALGGTPYLYIIDSKMIARLVPLPRIKVCLARQMPI